jgi:hypothetical protein
MQKKRNRKRKSEGIAFAFPSYSIDTPLEFLEETPIRCSASTFNYTYRPQLQWPRPRPGQANARKAKQRKK